MKSVNKMKVKQILLIYGTGGHTEEARRVLTSIQGELNEYEFISICDSDVKKNLTKDFYLVPSVTDKYSYLKVLLNFPKSFLAMMSVIKQVLNKYDIEYAISTGPGIGAISAIFLKFYGVKLIHVETNSRFYSKSLTGRMLYFLADYFFIQNEELQALYPRAIYKGRL